MELFLRYLLRAHPLSLSPLPSVLSPSSFFSRFECACSFECVIIHRQQQQKNLF